MGNTKYKKCSRCDLNWIQTEEEYCDVCKHELHMQTDLILLEDEDIDDIQIICPICKTNYMLEGEKICSSCRVDIKPKSSMDSSWRELYENDDTNNIETEEEEPEMSINDLEEIDEDDIWNDPLPDEDDFSVDLHIDDELDEENEVTEESETIPDDDLLDDDIEDIPDDLLDDDVDEDDDF